MGDFFAPENRDPLTPREWRRMFKEALEMVARLERDVAGLKRCDHEYETVENGNFRVYFNGTNAYIKCRKCGHRSQA